MANFHNPSVSSLSSKKRHGIDYQFLLRMGHEHAECSHAQELIKEINTQIQSKCRTAFEYNNNF